MTETIPTDSAPFDAVAEVYDQSFSDTRLGRWLRSQVRATLVQALPRAGKILEIGCGTGEDALWLAERGHDVIATDPSAAMLQRGRLKAERDGLDVRFVQWNSDEADGWSNAVEQLALETREEPIFDAVYSGFGALNCIRDRARLWAMLETWLRPGSPLIVVVMGPFCLLETVSFLLRGRPRQAMRRWSSPSDARVGGCSFPVWYPSVRTLERELDGAFVLEKVVGIGTLLPPSDHALLVERASSPFRVVSMIDPLFGRWGGWWIADHYLAWFERAGKQP